MKKIALAAVAALIATPAMAAPGDTDTASGSASAEIVSPIAITHDSGAVLSFGTMTAGNGGTVVVNRNGRGTESGDVTLVDGTATSADAFTVTGDANRSFSVTTTAGTVDDGGNSMSFTTNARNNGTLDAAGTVGFTVGGTLTVPDSQAPGSYVGTYDATVTYN